KAASRIGTPTCIPIFFESSLNPHLGLKPNPNLPCGYNDLTQINPNPKTPTRPNGPPLHFALGCRSIGATIVQMKGRIDAIRFSTQNLHIKAKVSSKTATGSAFGFSNVRSHSDLEKEIRLARMNLTIRCCFKGNY
ncbi:MAG TPA: hypothetical protein VKY92_18925, partial [Verrucomicrobiae bacterium]|nr:hypothetical protein [Verrucomicrobiae bacterium]